MQNSFTYIEGYFKWPSLKCKLNNVIEGLNGIRIPSEINPLLKERVSVLCVAKAFQKQP